MKAEEKVILFSLTTGLLFWPVSALVDYLFIYDQVSFWSLLTLGVPKHAIHVRLAVLAYSVAFSLLMSIIVGRRRRAEEALAAERERLSVTLRSIGDGVITTDMEGKVVLLNRIAEELTGWRQEEAIGKPLADVFHIVNEQTRAPAEDPVKKVLTEGGVIGLANNTVLVAKDGTERVIADSGAPVRDKDSKVIGVVLVFRDVTEQRKAEQEHQRAQKLHSVGILAGGIAHDFNNLLTAIWGNITLAKTLAVPGGKIGEKLTEAEKATSRAKDLTQQLLTFSTGGVPIRETASTEELVVDAANFALSGSNVRRDVSIADDLWPAQVDKGQIYQVLNNVIINADQAMPEGGTIRVRAENVALGAEDSLPLPAGDYVRISVQDEGVGIPPEHLSKIFDPYFTTKQKGSGLGLTTSYSIIAQHDGYIDVESEMGVGTTFHIYVPAFAGELQVKTKEADEVPTGEGRVLLMDDEELVLEVAGDILRELGYEAETATDGATAVELYRKAKDCGQPFDAVIMDLTIPGGLGGKETIQQLVQIDPEVKAIVSSGYSNDPIMADFGEYGFSGVVAKPYSISQIAETLHRVIMQKAA